MNQPPPFSVERSDRSWAFRMVLTVLMLAALIWLYARTENVAPAEHFAYTQQLRDLRELDATIDAELLANRLEFSRNYDALTEYTRRTATASALSLNTPRFLVADHAAKVQATAQALRTALDGKAELIDRFKRSSSVVRNSLAYFPVAVSDYLDSERPAPHSDRVDVDRYARAVLAFARAPSASGAVRIGHLREKVAALRLDAAQRGKVDNVLLHGDIIVQRLAEVDRLAQDIFGLQTGQLLEALNREYSAGHAHALTEASYYRMALFALAIYLLVFLSYTFMGLERARRSLQVAHVELSQRYAAEVDAANQLLLHATAFNSAHDGITLTDASGNILDVNPSFTRITGYDRQDVLGRNPRVLQSGRHDREFYVAMWRSILDTGNWRGEIWNRNKRGEVYPELLSISAVRDENDHITNYVAVFADIGRIKDQERQLTQMAYYDALTELPNRALLADRVVQAVAQTQRSKAMMAICYLDLDGFKQVNDTWGHEAGDRVLIDIAGRMKETLRGGDTVARLGGDEFVVLLLGLASMDECDGALRRLLHRVSQPLAHLPGQVALSASIGVTMYPADNADPDTLMRHADQAMYQAKLAGKNRYHVFDPAQDNSIRAHHEGVEHMRRALEQREFVLFYQPKVDMRRGCVIGAEALIRWNHPTKGVLPPSAFLPVIEDDPLAVDLGEWVIDAALSQLEQWADVGLELTISVNIGAQQLQRDDFVARLKAIMAHHPGVRPDQLELEVLETSALADIDQVSQVIEACEHIGVHFALDDFGTGYSSLTYLRRLRVATLKIDQSFVRDMLDDTHDLAILEGIIGLAAAFRREVIAEGVETVAHGAALLRLGCNQAQGYGIARPMPADRFPQWVANWHPDASWAAVQSLARS